MKTLKTIITATILLFAITSTQQVKGQTKEETIAWIKEKLEAYGNVSQSFGSTFEGNECPNSISSVIVSPCEISFQYSITCHGAAIDWPRYINVTIDLTKGKIKQREEGKDFGVWFDSNIVRCIYISNGKVRYGNHLNLHDGESNLIPRMEKAIKHLVTFCETKKEAF